MASTKLTITGMTCVHCVAKVEKALQNVDGVWGVFVDLDGGAAEVDFDDAKAGPSQLTEAVQAAGYEAKVG
jgi:copper ion binding protein